MEKEKQLFKNCVDSVDSRDNSFFCEVAVDESCRNPIEIIFESLTIGQGEKPYTWYKDLGYDKGFASKVRRGLLIPKYEDRIKIARYFGVDSSYIWRVQDIDYIKLILKKQKGDKNDKRS